MPLIHFIDKPKYTVGIWKIEEQEYNAEFSKVLHPNYHNDIQNYKNIKRKWQIHASKLLFEHLLQGESLSLNEIEFPSAVNSAGYKIMSVPSL